MKRVFVLFLVVTACTQKSESNEPELSPEQIKIKREVDSLDRLLDEEKNKLRQQNEAYEQKKKILEAQGK